MSKKKPAECAVIVGVGARAGIGAAIAEHAAGEGLHVYLAGRTQQKLDAVADAIRQAGGTATPVICDSTQERDVQALFAQVADSGAALRLVVYNVGRNIPAPFLQSDAQLIEGHWRRCVLGGLLVGQAAVRLMLEQEPLNGQLGTVLYTGASASMRGKPMFAAFAAAKAGLRNLAQSMARELGPQGIHVAHVVIDGVVDGEIVRSFGGGVGRLLLNRKGADGSLQPSEVAENFWAVHQQHRSAWSHELDLRPYRESF